MNEETTRIPHGQTAPSGAGSALAGGTRVGRLVVLEQVGEGGMGLAYAAYDTVLDRRVCLKFLKRIEHDDPSTGEIRLISEARALAQVSHPHILPLYDVGQFEDQVYLITEFVDGWTLSNWIAEDNPRPDQILAAYRSAGSGLAAAHAAGIVHRDFKPDNVMLGRDGRVRVMDFGLAASNLANERLSDGYGTPRYMAPEQLDGEAATSSSDQYAYCLSLAASLGADPDSLKQQPDRLSQLPISERHKRVLRRGLAESPDARFADMTSLLTDLAEEAPSTRRWPWTAAGAAVLALIGVGFWQWSPTIKPCADSPALVAQGWNPPAERALQLAFGATGSPVSGRGLALISEVMERFSSEWVASRTSACRATQVEQVQSAAMFDRRMLCFDRRLRERDAALTLFASADSKVVAETADILSTISPIARCNDIETMSSLRIPPVAQSQRSAFGEADAQLALAQVQFEAGRYDLAYASAERGSAAASLVDHPLLLARADFSLGMTAEPLDRLDLAEAKLESAFRRSIALGDDALAGATLARLLFLASSRRIDNHRVERWLGWKIALEPWFAHDVLISAKLDAEHGMALEPLEQWQDAQALLLRSRDHLVNQLGPLNPQSLRARGNYAGVLLMQGKMAEGALELEKLLPDMRAVLGDQHANLAAALGNLATAYEEIDRRTEALPLEREALAIVQANLGEEHSDVGRQYVALANSLLSAERPAEALEAGIRGDRILTESLGKDHPWRLAALTSVANAQHTLGDSALALESLDAGLRDGGWDELPHYQRAALKLTRTKVLITLERIAEARAELNAVRALLPELGGWTDWANQEIAQLDELIENTTGR